MEAARKFSPNFYNGPVPWQQYSLLRVDELDPSGIVFPPLSDIALLPPISGPPLPTLLSQQLLLLFLLDAVIPCNNLGNISDIFHGNN